MAGNGPTTPTAGRHRNVVRAISWLLAAVLIGLAVFQVVHNWRRIRFHFTGAVAVDGATLYLHPNDNYLTPLVLHHGEYEPTETSLVRQRLGEGDVFIDVGANIGWYTVLAGQQVGPGGKVIAFEPDPLNFQFLEKNVAANGLGNVVLERRALSNGPGSIKLFLNKGNLGRHSIVETFEPKDFVEVETIRLDDFLKDRPERVRLVKIDTEGAEGLILQGMRETLRQPQLELIVEYWPHLWIKSGCEPEQVLGELYQLGFQASVIDEANRKVVPLGRPGPKELAPFLQGGSPCNLHFQR